MLLAEVTTAHKDAVLAQFFLLVERSGGEVPVLPAAARSIDALRKEEVEVRVRAHHERMGANRRALETAGVDVEKLERTAQAKARELAKLIKEKGASNPAAVSMSFTEAFITLYNDAFSGRKKAEEWSYGFQLLVVVSCINTLAAVILALLAGPAVGMYLTAIVVAPIVEEGARRQALKHGGGLAGFTAVINVVEFVSYVGQALTGGVPFLFAISVRVVCAILHQFLGALQKWGYLRDLAAGEKPDEAGTVEWVTAMLCHASWNAFAGFAFVAIGKAIYGESTEGLDVDLQLVVVTDGQEIETTTPLPLYLTEGLGSFVKHLVVGDIDEEIKDLRAEVKDVQTPEQQHIVLRKVVALLERLVSLRHGQTAVAHFVHDSVTWFQNKLGERDPQKELNLRLGEALRDVADLRDQLLAKKWGTTPEASEMMEELRAAAKESLDRVRAAGPNDFD